MLDAPDPVKINLTIWLDADCYALLLIPSKGWRDPRHRCAAGENKTWKGIVFQAGGLTPGLEHVIALW